MILSVIIVIAMAVFLIVTGIFFLQGKGEKLALALLPKKDIFNTKKRLRFGGIAQIVLGVLCIVPAVLLYLGYFAAARISLLIILVLMILETIYEYTGKTFRK